MPEGFATLEKWRATDQPSSYPSGIQQSLLQPRSPAYSENGTYDMADECIGLKLTVGILVTVSVIILCATAFWFWRYHKRHREDTRKLDLANMEIGTLRNQNKTLQKKFKTLLREEKEMLGRKEKQDIQHPLRESLASAADPAADRHIHNVHHHHHLTPSDHPKNQNGSNRRQKEEDEFPDSPESHHISNNPPIPTDDETAYHSRRWYADTGGAFQPAPARALHRPLTSSSVYSQPSHI
ncbi:MAG: hypothetical protein Q9212_001201 [Teloschistes hypoglaucus]